MIRDFFQSVIHYIKKEYKFLIFIILLFIILNFPLNYYIDVGGGISDVSSRIEVEDAYESKGSFNLSYVTQIQANVLTYGLSYLIPTWDRIDIGDYKYDASEDIRDVEFRSDLDLVTAISTSEYWAYTLAGREIREVDSKIYVIATSGDEFPNELKVADEIVSVDGNRYSNVDEYIYYIQEKNVGDSVTFQIVRNKKEMEVPCQIYQYEDRKLIGVVLQIAKDYEMDPKVSIAFRSAESGPSGGLITTLEIYNQLTKEDLTKGKVIAGTGTIEGDGSVGEIGGIEYKVLGAASAHADIFLCPNGDNYEAAKKYIKDKKLKIKLIAVDTIYDAIEKLEGLD